VQDKSGELQKARVQIRTGMQNLKSHTKFGVRPQLIMQKAKLYAGQGHTNSRLGFQVVNFNTISDLTFDIKISLQEVLKFRACFISYGPRIMIHLSPLKFL
jgi:hypothetical protein